MKPDVVEKLAGAGVVPVLTLHNADQAVPVCRAIAEGGLSAVEITFRTPAAAACIARVSRELPQLTVGAGTVLTVASARAAKKAGAAFLVAPGLNPRVVRWAKRHGMPMIPGVATPTEVEAAMALGLSRLKLFPAQVAGGVKLLKNLAGPYGEVSFMCTGGINADNAAEFLSQKNVYAVGGSWMASVEMIRAAGESGDYSPVRQASAAAAELAGKK